MPSYEDLTALVVEQAATITQLRAELTRANKQITDLEAKRARTLATSS